MSINVKVVLRTDKLPSSDGYPIMTRITINRRIQYFSLRKYCTKELWNPDSSEVKKKHKQSDEINLLIKTIYSDIEFFKMSEAKNRNSLTFETIKKCIQKSLGDEPNPYSKKIYEVFNDHIIYLKKNQRLAYAEIFESTLKSIKSFTNNIVNNTLILRKFQVNKLLMR